jgi:hypothetical protein
MVVSARSVPLIVGVGQLKDRRGGAEPGLRQISYRGLDPAALLLQALRTAAKHVVCSPWGSGDTPIHHLNHATNAIARGETQVCLLTGGASEPVGATGATARSGDTLHWHMAEHLQSNGET